MLLYWTGRLRRSLPMLFRCAVAFSCLCLVSCAHQTIIPDVMLSNEGDLKSGVSQEENSGSELRKWKEFYFYENASVVMENDCFKTWLGDYVGKGTDLAVFVNEGSKLINTTAHPQYYKIWVTLPANLSKGMVFPVRSADSRRTVIHKWDHNVYGSMKIGELSLDGMRGYDSPHCKFPGRQLGEVRILERTPDSLSINIRAVIPVSLFPSKEEYTLNIDRNYQLERRDPIQAMTDLLRAVPRKTQDGYLKHVDYDNRKLVLERLGIVPDHK